MNWKTFVTAGDATFTVELPPGHEGSDCDHYTYRVQRVETNGSYPESWFVKMLTGPDNERSYTYVGKLSPATGGVALTKKSKLTHACFAYRLLCRVLARVWADEVELIEAAGFRLHHEGKCGRCGHKLTTPESCETGFGPECREILGIDQGRPALCLADPDF